MQLVLLSLMLTLAHTLYYDWPIERRALEDRLEYRQRSMPESGYLPLKESSPTFVRERRAKRLCGQKFIEHLLVLCNSCILPAGSEIVKRSLMDDEATRQTVQRLMKRELSIAKKCCAGQCQMSELEALCCKNG